MRTDHYVPHRNYPNSPTCSLRHPFSVRHIEYSFMGDAGVLVRSVSADGIRLYGGDCIGSSRSTGGTVRVSGRVGDGGVEVLSTV